MKNYSPELFCNLLISESNTLDNFYITDNVNTQVEILNNVFLKSRLLRTNSDQGSEKTFCPLV